MTNNVSITPRMRALLNAIVSHRRHNNNQSYGGNPHDMREHIRILEEALMRIAREEGVDMRPFTEKDYPLEEDD